MRRTLSAFTARVLFAGVVGAAVAAAPLPAQQLGDAADALRPHAAAWAELLAAEDARATTDAELERLVAGTRAAEPALRAMAVRALGRLERPDVATEIAPLLRDDDAGVRALAAHALAQAVLQQPRGAVRGSLARALVNERDPAVRAALAESLGRMRHADVEQARITITQLLPLLDEGDDVRLGALRGIYLLARQADARAAVDTTAAAAIRAVIESSARSADDDGAPAGGRLRTVALATLGAAGLVDPALLDSAVLDRAPLVRREVMLLAGMVTDTAAVRRVVSVGLADSTGTVRFEALRTFGRRLAQTHGCDAAREALDDADTHVALHAITLLGGVCDTHAADMARLDALAATLPPGRREAAWHRPVHALLALATKSPDHAAARLDAFAGYPNYFVRAHAARAAVLLGDTARLRRLATDAHPNVRTAAVQGLHATVGRAADEIFIEQLEQDDSQLLQAAAAALEGTERAAAPYALLDALDRISTARRETSRDARRALLVRLGEVGSETHAPRIGAYLTDFDPQIAELAADVLEGWTGDRPPAAAAPVRDLPLPTFDEIATLADSELVIELEAGGVVVLRLHAFDAPTNVARFARLARAGYYDGLTLHRVVPNFVVQGGSPNANEYTGDGPFTRDEVGVPNWRGAVGLSTRGRDTGDAQLYINTVDNVRLDHQYTVWAEVVSGMDAVDAVQEGAVMRRVHLRRAD